MKKIYYLFFILFMLAKGTASFSQTINATTYPFTAASGTTLEDMSTGTTTLVPANSDDGVSGLTSMGSGFIFYFAGVPYTQFEASANGYIRLGTTVSGPITPVDYTNNLGSANQSPVIAPYWDDLYIGASTGKIHFKLTGTAPNRKLVIEWLNEQIPYVGTATAGAGIFQLWLSEATGKIDFLYGTGIVANSGGASIGINKSASVFASVTASANTVSYAAANDLNTAAVASGTNYMFAPLGATPAVPATPTFTSVTTSSMDVNWVDNSTNETYFIVKRSLSSSGPFAQIGTLISSTIGGTGTGYTFSVSGLAPSTTYYYQIEAANESSAPSANLTANQITNPAGNIVSTPAGGLWSSPSTWVSGTVPTATDIVTIADGASVTIDVASNAYSVIVGQGVSGTLLFEPATARTLTVGGDITVMSGASFTSGAGALTTHSVVLGGNLTNNGMLDLASGTSGSALSFNGAANSTFSGTGAITNLYTLAAAKSSLAQVIELNLSNFSVRGLSAAATGALLTSSTGTGTIKFSGSNTFSGQLWSAAAYTIPATLGIWINNPNFTVTGLAGSATLSGLFRMTTGIYNIGTATGNSMGFSTGSNITVEGGVINATGRFGVAAAGNVISYTQTGGTITVCTIGNTSTTLGSFDVGTSVSSPITMSGGTIIHQLSATTIDYRNQAGNGILTGGTVQLGNAASGAAKAFSLRGNIPNLVLTNTSANHTASMSTVIVSYYCNSLNITIGVGNTLNLGNSNFFFDGTTLTNNGVLTHTGASSVFYWGNQTATQFYTGTGTVTAPMTLVASQNPIGITIDPASPNIPIAFLALFSGDVTNANKITMGNGGATTATLQIGNTTTPSAAGNFDQPLTFNLGTGGMRVSYLRTNSVTRNIINEIPPSRILTALTIDDNDATHSLKLTAGNLTISSGTTPTFTFTNGKVDLGTSVLTLGLNGTTTALAGAMTTGAGSYLYNGQFKRWISATTGNRDFPMGIAAAKKALSINFTAVPTAAGTLTASWSSAPPSFPNAVPLTEGANIVNGVSKNGSWFVDAADGLAGGTYTTTVTANGTTDVLDYTKAVLVKRPSSGGDWTLDGTPAANTGSNAAPTLSRTGMSGFSEFAIGGEAGVVLPISLEYFTGRRQATGNVLDWKVSSTSTSVLTLERSIDKVIFKGINVQTATIDRMLTPFTYTDAAPAAGINYYRLKITNADGESKYSNVVALINKEKGFELISVIPNPVQHNTVLSLSSVKSGKMELSVSDVAGRIVMKQNINVIAGNNPVTLNFAALASGTYQITAVNADGDSKSTRFVKL